MTRRILALLLVLCLLSGCAGGVPSPRRAAVPAQKIPCCPLSEQEPVVRELPDDTQGSYVMVTMMLPRELPEEIFGPDGSMTLFTAHYFNNYPELSYRWDGEFLGEEQDLSASPVSAPGNTEVSVKIPFRDSITFYTTDAAVYDNGMKVSAAFHYKDGRTVEVSFDGVGLAEIVLDTHGTIAVTMNPYVYEEGMTIDVEAGYKGIDTDVTQILRGKKEALYCKAQLLHGRLAAEALADCTLTAVDSAGNETVTSYTGEEFAEHYWGYQDYDYCTVSYPSIGGVQIETPDGSVLDPLAETVEISDERNIYRYYSPGVELGPPHFALDVPWQESFRFSLSPNEFRWWTGVTYKSPEGQKGTVCVSGIPSGTAELFWDGTAVLEGDLSEFTVFYLPPGEETVLSLTGKGQEQVTVYYDNGKLTAYGTGVEYTVEETDLSAMPFDPGELPAIIDAF